MLSPDVLAPDVLAPDVLAPDVLASIFYALNLVLPQRCAMGVDKKWPREAKIEENPFQR